METIALAACILDALSSRFGRRWRRRSLSLSSASHPRLFEGVSPSALRSEVIVLSALALATAFFHDDHSSTLYWAQHVSSSSFTVKQINATSNCILEDIDYALSSLAAPDSIQRAMQDMHKAVAASPDRSSLTSKRSQRQILCRSPQILTAISSQADIPVTDPIPFETSSLRQLAVI